MLFLKVIKCTKHYEDITLIHYTLTGKSPPNLESIEQNLLNDLNKTNSNIHSFPLDVKDESNTKKVFQNIIEKLQSIDI